MLSCATGRHTAESINGRYSEEADFVLDAIREYSIDTLRGLTPEQWQASVEKMRDKVRECKDDTSYYFALRYFGPLLKDAHFLFPGTGVFNREGIFKPSDLVFSVWTKSWEDGRLFAVHDYEGKIPKHAEIISINGLSSREMVVEHRRINCGEEKYMQAWINENEECDPRGLNTFANYLFCERINAPFEVVYREYGSEELRHTSLAGIARDKRFEMYRNSLSEKAGALWDYRPASPAVEYYMANDSVAVLKINSFWSRKLLSLLIFGKDFKFPKMLKKAMKEINSRKAKRLVVDIRGNGGGFVDNLYLTLACLGCETIKDPLRMKINRYNRKNARVILRKTYKNSMAGRKEIKTALKIFDETPDGSFFNSDTLFPVVYKSPKISTKYKFSGDKYLLVSANVYSAGIDFVNHFKKMNLGTIVGESPGGYRQTTSGYCANIELPYSKMLRLSIPYGINGVEYFGTYDFAEPDVLIERKFQEWLLDKDSTMDSLLRIIAGR
jgi:hypothetical protein